MHIVYHGNQAPRLAGEQQNVHGVTMSNFNVSIPFIARMIDGTPGPHIRVPADLRQARVVVQEIDAGNGKISISCLSIGRSGDLCVVRFGTSFCGLAKALIVEDRRGNRWKLYTELPEEGHTGEEVRHHHQITKEADWAPEEEKRKVMDLIGVPSAPRW